MRFKNIWDNLIDDTFSIGIIFVLWLDTLKVRSDTNWKMNLNDRTHLDVQIVKDS